MEEGRGAQPDPGAGPVVCLGEALVDFVAERPVARVTEAPSFAPRFGGSPANIAAGAARFGARSALVGGAGDDPWGRWLRGTLAAEGVDTSWFRLLPGVPTPHTFVAVDERGEPAYAFFGDGREACVASAAERLAEPFGQAAGGAGAAGVFVFGSDTLIGERERATTLRARELALERGWRVLYDPNLRAARWPDEAAMRDSALSAVAGAGLVKANVAEVRLLTGREEPGDAARALIERGAGAVLVTLGAAGLLLARPGAEDERVAAPPARAVDATGAGDSVAAVLAAALARGRAAEALRPVLELAARTAAGVVAAPGALTGLPPAAAARAALDRALA